MNLLLLTPDDHLGGARYAVADLRADHLKEVLRVEPGDAVRAGVLDGPRGEARVISAEADRVVVEVTLEAEPPPRPDLDLLLALPRPRSLKKLLPEVTALGIRRLVLTETHRVEKAFFGATFLKPARYRPLLFEGMMQAKLTWEPEVTVARQLWRFLEEEVPDRYAGHRKLVAHPEAATPLAGLRLSSGEPLLLAVGPEGGFLDREVERLQQAGFEAVTMGSKTLRVETACVGLLAQIDLLRQQTGGGWGGAAGKPLVT